MADISYYQAIEFAFTQLLTDLAKSWSMQDVAYVRDMVTHAEYGEALENLIATGLQNARGFSDNQRLQAISIGNMMQIDAGALFISLGNAGGQRHKVAAA